MDVRIREAPLPGIGYRCELALDRNCRLFVVVQRSGERELGIMRAGADEPEAVVSLTHDQAVALSALLSGARLSVDKAEGDQAEANVVAVHTVTLGPSSPAVGLRMREIPLPADDDTAILGGDPRHHCRADRGREHRTDPAGRPAGAGRPPGQSGRAGPNPHRLTAPVGGSAAHPPGPSIRVRASASVLWSASSSTVSPGSRNVDPWGTTNSSSRLTRTTSAP